MVDVDDDLQGLLQELDIGPEINLEPSQAPVVQDESKPVLDIVLEEHLSVQSPDEDPVTALVPKEEPSTELDEQSQDIINLREFILKHDRDYEEAKGNLRVDRAKADEVVRLLLVRVDAGTASNQETESLVQAVKCLVDSNGHMVRLLDSKSKLLTASKGSVNTLIQQNFGNKGSNPELEDILTQRADEDEA